MDTGINDTIDLDFDPFSFYATSFSLSKNLTSLLTLTPTKLSHSLFPLKQFLYITIILTKLEIRKKAKIKFLGVERTAGAPKFYRNVSGQCNTVQNNVAGGKLNVITPESRFQ